jgi:hypothetical protein
MLRDAYVAVNGRSSFSCPLEWCCSCGGFVLDSAVCVCVCVCVCMVCVCVCAYIYIHIDTITIREIIGTELI